MTKQRRLLSWLLVVAMVFTMLPTVFAADVDATTLTKITTADEFVSGKYVLVTSTGYAPTYFDSSTKWVLAEQVTLTDGALTGVSDAAIWNLTVEESTVKLTDSNGVTIAPKGGNTNGIQAGEYAWSWTCTDGAFKFLGTESDTVTFASNKGAANKFRAYMNATVSDSPNGYPSDFTLYKVNEGTSPDPEPEPEPDPEPDPGTEQYAKLTDTLANGEQFVLFYNKDSKVMTDTASGKGFAVSDTVTPEGDFIKVEEGMAVLTAAKDADGNYTFTNAEGKYLTSGATGSSLSFADEASDYSLWTISAVTGGVHIVSVNAAYNGNAQALEVYNGVFTMFSEKDTDYYLFNLYKLTDEKPAEEPDPNPNPDPEPEPECSTIAEALAGETDASFTVKGVVTLVDKQNIYLQDETGGICAYMSAAPSDIALGDTIIATGSRTTYNGLPELASATYEKSAGMTLTAKETAIGELTTADVCTYVKLTGLEITEVYDKDGTYTTPNITVKDAEGNTIQLYKAIINKNEDGTWEYAVGDLINITAAVGVYQKNNTGTATLQLRNTSASEITLTPKTQYAKLNNTIEDGDQLVVYYNKDSLVMADAASGKGMGGVAATPNGDFIKVEEGMSVLTASKDADGNYTFTNAEGKYLTSGATGNSLTFADAASDFSLWTISAVTGGVHIVSVHAAYNGNAQALEVYNGVFTTFTEKDNDYYLFNLYKLTDEEPEADSGMPAVGDQVVIYNLSSKGVLSAQDDNLESPSITNADAEIVEGGVDAANGAVVFTVGQKDGYYSFYNETYGYLCSNGTGNNAFYCKTESENGDELWTLAPQGTGYTMESKVAKYNGQYSQYLEYYAGAYKTYSMYNVTDYDIYTFQFYPCVNQSVTEGIVNEPRAVADIILDAYVGQDYSLLFKVDAVFGVKEISVKLGDDPLTYEEMEGIYAVTVPAEKVLGDQLTITVSGVDNKDVSFTNDFVTTVVDEPLISDVKPVAGSQTKEDKKPEISAAISNAGENPTVVMTLNGTEVTAACEGGRVIYTPAEDMVDGRVNVTVTVTRADGKTASRSWSFTVGETTEQLYFGQLHSHTSYSDGSGSIDTALSYISSLPDSANVDFVAFTDHSNYFDKSGAANPEGALYDMSLATEYSQTMWAEFNGKVDTFNEGQSSVVALPGFEMTWSGGPGHINTFATPGIVSRNNTTLNNKTGDAGMKAYYALLSQTEGADSISQFNHPGSTFGTFADFSYWDAMIDSRIYTVEVGNGEGQIGAGGYYPSYEYYTMALDKGWHLAPTNNQDNHKGKWGNANDARDVILTDDFSEQGLYAAIRQYKVYSTEDKNL
ncbi:MAG: hypothetical protein PUC06_00605, partial [Oscillospiraceae bacterium]|nr:hypothetical protein [Oscillospiraceae bacterium]